MIDQTIKIAKLFDAYGALLTQRQQKCIELHYFDDLSLAEVAEHFSVSRQAVHDILRRSVQSLEEFEDKLGFVADSEKQEQSILEMQELIDQAIKEQGEINTLCTLREKISSFR